MKRTIKKVKKGIVQLTTIDERWYIKTNGAGEEIFVPSVTWIASYFPKGIGFFKWLANTGWDEAQAQKQAAADKGSKVHQAIVKLLNGETIKMDDELINPDTGEQEELTVEEYECLMSFVLWFNDTKPVTLSREMVVFNTREKYAGTIDYLCKIGDKIWLVDFKTSQTIWPEHELQVSAYKYALPGPDMINLAILQLGYRRNKKGYKFTEIEDNFHLFLSAKAIWAHETKGIAPLKKDYPENLFLEKEEELGNNGEPIKEFNEDDARLQDR